MKKRLFSIMEMSRKGKGVAAFCLLAIVVVTLLTGNVFAAPDPPNHSSQHISEAEAKTIALAHAGLSETQVTFIKAHLERDDGRVVYDVEFYSGNVEYDYEIDAASGLILEFDRDIENYSIPNNSAMQNTTPPQSTPVPTAAQHISEAEAKTIALAHAGLSEAQVSRMKIKLDREDGIMVYEVEFNNGRLEYEYEINAETGRILKTDVDYDD